MNSHDPRDHYGAYIRHVDPAYGGALGRGDTRQAAHIAIQPIKGELQLRVMMFLKRQGPCTVDHFECATGMSHQSASARFTELRNAGLIEDSGERGRTRSGRTAVVWRIRA